MMQHNKDTRIARFPLYADLVLHSWWKSKYELACRRVVTGLRGLVCKGRSKQRLVERELCCIQWLWGAHEGERTSGRITTVPCPACDVASFWAARRQDDFQAETKNAPFRCAPIPCRLDSSQLFQLPGSCTARRHVTRWGVLSIFRSEGR